MLVLHAMKRKLLAAAAVVVAVREIFRRRRAARRTVLSDRHTLDDVEAIHAAKVRRIATDLAARPGPVSLRKHGVPHQVPKATDRRRLDDKLDVSDLSHILHVDPVNRLCTAESGATFDDVVAATLRHGLVPLVVPELRTITVGGAVSGCSVESMSFKYGGFHDTCLEYEVITATGDVLACTPDNANKLVFQMMHGSFGTLGVLAKLTFRLVPAEPFVHVTYEHHACEEDFHAAIQRHFAARDVDFMDGIIHARDHLVLCVGQFVPRAPYANAYDWTKVYYESTALRDEDYLATPDYLFRYDHGVTRVHPKHPLARLLVGWLMDSHTTLWLANKLPGLLVDEDTVTLDTFLPFSRAGEFLAWHDDALGHYPLWCVPYKRVRDYEWLDQSFYAGLDDDLFLDLAIYGMPENGRNVYRMLEEKLRELGGVKTLIARNFYSEGEFWSIWNKPNYDAVKAITDPDNAFRDLYTKTSPRGDGRRVDFRHEGHHSLLRELRVQTQGRPGGGRAQVEAGRRQRDDRRRRGRVHRVGRRREGRGEIERCVSGTGRRGRGGPAHACVIAQRAGETGEDHAGAHGLALATSRRMRLIKLAILALFVASPVLADKPKLTDTEKVAIDHEHTDNQTEIHMGKMAQTKSTTGGVRDYARTLVADHQKADDELLALAKKKSYSPGKDVAKTDEDKAAVKDDENAMAKLATAKGVDFDQQFLAMMIVAHEREIARLDGFIGAATDPDVRALLEAIKPVMQKHVDLAKEQQKNAPTASK